MDSVFAGVIRSARERRGWSKRDLAERMIPPRGRTAVVNLEGGARLISEAVLVAVAAACGLTLPDFFLEELVEAGALVRVDDGADLDAWRTLDEPSFLAGVIRGARTREGWTQQRLATHCGPVGNGPFPQANVSQWETSGHPISERTLHRVAGALGVSVLDMIAGELVARGYARLAGRRAEALKS